jgi:hypothetical protein
MPRGSRSCTSTYPPGAPRAPLPKPFSKTYTVQATFDHMGSYGLSSSWMVDSCPAFYSGDATGILQLSVGGFPDPNASTG